MAGTEDRDEARSARDPRRGRRARRRWITAIGAAVVVIAVAAAALLGSSDDEPTPVREVSASDGTTSTIEPPPSTTATPTTTAPPTTTTAPPPPPPPPTTAAPPTTTVATSDAFCLGDSVMLGASGQYHGTLDMCGEVDAVVGRPLSAGIPIAQSRGSFPATVIVHLGTNGTVTASQVDSLLAPLSGVPRVLLVNVQTNQTRSWETSVNAELAAADTRWANVTLVDWNGASDGHPEHFTDGIHITASGASAYAATIRAAL